MRLLLEMFYDISFLLTLGPSLDSVLQEMFKKTKEQTGISSILIWVLDQKKEFFDLAASCHLPQAMIDVFKSQRLRKDQGTPGAVLKTKKFYLMKDIFTDPRAVPLYIETILKTKIPMKSIVSFPMIIMGEKIGVLSFFFSEPKESISRIEFIIFSTIANQIASFIKNAGMLVEVKEEKNKTLAIINNFSDGLLVLNGENKFSLINPQTEKFLKIKAEKLIGKSFSEIKKDSSLAPLAEIFGKELKDIFRKELAADKEPVLEVSSISIMSGEEKIGTLIILHDITREKALEKMKSEFVSLAAHQLRTPLSATKWSMRMLIDGDLGELKPEQKELLENGYQSNERMIGLINDLLDVARIEEGRFGYNFVFADIRGIIDKAIKEQSLIAKKRNIDIIFQKPSEHFPKVKIDPSKIELVIENLLENALYYTLSGGSIKISIKPRNEFFLEVTVKDNGIGIPKHQMSRLFSKFFRGENAVQMQTVGSGLGLFIAKNIVKEHGGEIWVDSKEGEGTEVHFTLLLK